MKNIGWDKLELVIFDVDGTLYDQKKLRRRMLGALISYYIFRPWKYKDLLILYHFRKEREKKAGYQSHDLQLEQYSWVLQKVSSSVGYVNKVVDKWIFDVPNKFLKEYMYPGTTQFLNGLLEAGILTAIYSDYDAAKKMKSMDVSVDLIVSSTEPWINAFKPLPNGLNYILSDLKIKHADKCLFIGDREELDGKCSELAGIPFLLLKPENARIDFYKKLSEQLAKTRSRINK